MIGRRPPDDSGWGSSTRFIVVGLILVVAFLALAAFAGQL